MINFDDYTNERKKRKKREHNPKWPCILDHPYSILIIEGSGLGTTNALSNLINDPPDIDEIYLYSKDPYEAKYQCLIKKREKVGLKHYDNPKAFIELICKIFIKILKNLGKKLKVLIVFDNMIADMINKKKIILW